MKGYSILILFFCATLALQAQELKATAKVATPKLQTTDPKVFKTLEQSVEDFLNGQKWTEDFFEDEERIKCSFQITITEELGDNRFRADLAIKSSRPIFGASQETVMFSHLDKELEFSYQEFQPIQYTKNGYTDELSQVLAFYVHIILGLDYDSFSENGGTIYFQEAGNIINIAPKSAGWNASKKNNRFQIFESITNPRSIPFRKAIYQYHRQGLDVMADTPETGRDKIMNALEKTNQVNKDFLNAFILQIFANSKTTELVEIFKQAPSNQKSKFVTIMSKIDPTKARKYRAVNGR